MCDRIKKTISKGRAKNLFAILLRRLGTVISYVKVKYFPDEQFLNLQTPLHITFSTIKQQKILFIIKLS
jgi:hypothetical protein